MAWLTWWRLVAACGAGTASMVPPPTGGDAPAEASVDTAADGDAASPRDGGFAPEFAAYLEQRGWSDLVESGGVGGGARPTDAEHDPVVFVHGNGDRAIGGALGGWSAPMAAYAAEGWDEGLLFAVTWGPGDPLLASQQDHDRANVLAVRRFLEAVLDYTEAAHIDVVAHSMGVTLARLAIAGGPVADDLGAYDVGDPLTDRVDAFVAIAGANLGLASCWSTGGWVPTCGRVAGLWPGTRYGWAEVSGRSHVLEALRRRPGAEGARRFALWSRTDEILGVGALVWGEVTARLPEQTDEVILSGVSHLETRDTTTAIQVGWLDAP
jgi:triacylglycerol lipase